MTMSKIIIRNDSDLGDAEAIMLVAKVVSDGRISNNDKQYCYVTQFTMNAADSDESNKFIVVTGLNKKSDTFRVFGPRSGIEQPKHCEQIDDV